MSTEKAQATRERILLAADKLFYQYGYHATGLERILQAAQVTKGNFYYHFKSKEALALATMDWHFEHITQHIKSITTQYSSPHAALFAVLDLFAELITTQKQAGGIFGCYFGNFSLELGNENAAVRSKLSDVFKNYQASFAALLAQARQAQELPESIQVEQTAAIIVSLLEGALVVDKANQQAQEIYRAVAFLKRYLTKL